MHQLIVGHVDGRSARVWVRGTAARPVAFLTLSGAGAPPAARGKSLRPGDDFTGVVRVTGLRPATDYACRVAFGATPDTSPAQRLSPPEGEGRFRTAPETAGTPFDFLLGSCNMRPQVKSSRAAFEALLRRARGSAFMIHCGDQIYYERNRPPELRQYRQKYKDAWGASSPEARRFLTRLPHYMILDDHEIENNFRNDMDPRHGTIAELRRRALKAYREYQHSRNPQGEGSQALYYRFRHGRVRFFVLDCRSERFADRGQMIGRRQMNRFLSWLRSHRTDVKFVVTSVPFVGEFTTTARARDRWTGLPYRAQRERILTFIGDERIRPPVFLTGDMHNSYHAVLRLSHSSAPALTIHELMSSPVSQRQYSPRERYANGVTRTLPGGWRSRTSFGRKPDGSEHFFTGESNAMRVRVTPRRIHFRIFSTERDSATPDLRGSFAYP